MATVHFGEKAPSCDPLSPVRTQLNPKHTLSRPSADFLHWYTTIPMHAIASFSKLLWRNVYQMTSWSSTLYFSKKIILFMYHLMAKESWDVLLHHMHPKVSRISWSWYISRWDSHTCWRSMCMEKSCNRLLCSQRMMMMMIIFFIVREKKRIFKKNFRPSLLFDL